MFDKNHDGKISCEELGVVLRTLGHRYSQAEVEEMIKNADKNGEASQNLCVNRPDLPPFPPPILCVFVIVSFIPLLSDQALFYDQSFPMVY